MEALVYSPFKLGYSSDMKELTNIQHTLEQLLYVHMVYQLLTTTEVMGSSYKLKNQLISKIITAEACFPQGFIPPFGPIFLSLIFELNQMNLKTQMAKIH